MKTMEKRARFRHRMNQKIQTGVMFELIAVNQMKCARETDKTKKKKVTTSNGTKETEGDAKKLRKKMCEKARRVKHNNEKKSNKQSQRRWNSQQTTLRVIK